MRPISEALFPRLEISLKSSRSIRSISPRSFLIFWLAMNHPSYFSRFLNPVLFHPPRKMTCLAKRGCVASMPSMKKRSLNLLLLVILLGLGVSIYLTSKHFQIMTRGLQGSSFCNINETFDCDSVLMSRFAELGPFPVAGLGLVFFAYLLFPALYARIALDEAKSLLALPFVITALSLLLAAYLAVVSTFILKSFCL